MCDIRKVSFLFYENKFNISIFFEKIKIKRVVTQIKKFLTQST